MSAAEILGERWKLRRRVLADQLRLHLWYPHVFIALVLAPLGLLMLVSAVDGALGIELSSLQLDHLTRNAAEIEHGHVIEGALGVSLIAMSLWLALRSRLAWLWSVGATAVGLSLQLPPETTDVPLALYFGGLLALLLFHRKGFANTGVFPSVASAIVILAAFFVWATLGTLRLGEEFEPPVHDMATAVYFTIVTVSSVGYGDILARGPEARLFVVMMIVLGLLVGATVLSSVVLPLIGGRLRKILGGRDMDRSNHYVIVGKSPLARNAALELENRKQTVTLVLPSEPEDEFYRERDVVTGDPTDLSVLRSAGAPKARGVLALSTDDATNGFVVLGVNELDGSIPTVAALNDPANKFRLKRTQPSMMLSLHGLGGQLLAMALTGEHVDVGMLSDVLQVHEAEKDA